MLVTAAGLAKLETELAELVNVRRPAVLRRIRDAKSLGDLRENFDYHDAKREQGFIEGRIQALKETLACARVVSDDELDTDAVGIGSAVDLVSAETGNTSSYTIVGAVEADPANGKISNVSPVGKALMGRKVGDTVEIVTPRGARAYRIAAIRAGNGAA